MSDRWDLVVIGGGPGGHAAALHAARLGGRVAIVEQQAWGGTCTHRGCIPTKALLACSGHYASLKKLKRMGVSVGEAAFDYAAMKRHQAQMVRISSLGVEKSLHEARVTMKTGRATILSPSEVQHETAEGITDRFETEKIVIAWGSEPQVPPGMTLSRRVLTSDGLLALDPLPGSVIIVGGSVIGVEFATFLAELGVKVTVIELLDRLLPTEDEEASDALKQELKRLGVAIHTATAMDDLCEQPSGVVVKASSAVSGKIEFAAEYVLICTGRHPRLRTGELDHCGIAHGRQGILVNDLQTTSVDGIYAVGDVTGGMMLAHRAMQQGKSLAIRLFGDGSAVYREDAVPSVIYTHPNIARVGLTEAKARDLFRNVDVVRSEYAANIMARTELQGQGFSKLLFHQDRFIGATLMGEQAAELIAPLSLAMAAGLDRRSLQSWVIPHPTLSEVLQGD